MNRFTGTGLSHARVRYFVTRPNPRQLRAHALQNRAASVPTRRVTRNRHLQVWDPQSWTTERTLSDHTGPVRCFAQCADRLLSGSDDGSIKVIASASQRGEACRGMIRAAVLLRPFFFFFSIGGDVMTVALSSHPRVSDYIRGPDIVLVEQCGTPL